MEIGISGVFRVHKKGKAVADAEVSDRLYQRAMGFVAPDIDIRVIENRIVETPLKKYYPPDTTAAIFWLKNRQKDKWREKQDVNHTSDDGSMTPKAPVYNIVKSETQ